MTDAQYALRFLTAGAETLKDYLLSQELFWSLGLRTPKGRRSYPQLTLGNLLLFKAQLQAWQKAGALSARESADLTKTLSELETIHGKWRVAWETKAAKEFDARLRQWANYLDELGKGEIGSYSYEAETRAKLELLSMELGHAAKRDDLQALDARLRGKLTKGDFIWDKNLAAAFPESIYWFLYAKIKT